MPRDANGVYTLPAIYLAVTGTTIIAAQHNGPLEDIRQALTDSLPRSGVAAMEGALKLADGTPAAPGLTFNSQTNVGLTKTTNGIGVVIGAEVVAEFTADGLIGLPIGTPIFVPDGTLPPLCVWADGRNISRATYDRLFAKWGTKYGVGNGTTTFGVMDVRGTSFVGRDNFGGTDANRLTNVPAVSGNRLTTGSIIGGNLHTLSGGEVGTHTHPVSVSGTFNDVIPAFSGQTFSTAPPQFNLTVATSTTTTSNSVASSGTASANSGGNAHNNVPRSLVCDVAIYAGA
jgi:microcystin-dependent protein